MNELSKFLSGFKNFQDDYFCAEKEYFADLKQGQNPKAIVVACSDSRVDPAILMGCDPGDIFVIRNVANLIPPYESFPGHHGVSAGLEYGVKNLNVRHIIVLGHSSCGGIKALLSPDRDSMGEFLAPWVGIAQAALQTVENELAGESAEMRQRACELAAILVSLENLLSFAWIKERVAVHSLYLHGWYFDMHSGELLSYFPETKDFEVLVSRRRWK